MIRILIVDEAAFVRDALKRSLRRFLKDVEVHDANAGKKAISVLRANKIDVIIGDWALPDMSGQEFLTWVRESDVYAKAPFIVTSDEGDRNIVIKAIELGANDFLAKPFSPDEVQKKVVKQLSRIGYKPKMKIQNNESSGFGSLDALTGAGGAARPLAAKVTKPVEVQAASGFGKAPSPSAPSPKVIRGGNFAGKAHLRFEGFSADCEISEMSLTGLNGAIEREKVGKIPRIFDSASADIENAAGQNIGQLQVYVHSLQASDPRPDASRVKIGLRFANNSPEQFERLSKAIAGGT